GGFRQMVTGRRQRGNVADPASQCRRQRDDRPLRPHGEIPCDDLDTSRSVVDLGYPGPEDYALAQAFGHLDGKLLRPAHETLVDTAWMKVADQVLGGVNDEQRGEQRQLARPAAEDAHDTAPDEVAGAVRADVLHEP